MKKYHNLYTIETLDKNSFEKNNILEDDLRWNASKTCSYLDNDAVKNINCIQNIVVRPNIWK